MFCLWRFECWRQFNWDTVVDYVRVVCRWSVQSEYCEAETFRASCPVSTVIVVRRALYGRMRPAVSWDFTPIYTIDSAIITIIY